MRSRTSRLLRLWGGGGFANPENELVASLQRRKSRPHLSVRAVLRLVSRPATRSRPIWHGVRHARRDWRLCTAAPGAVFRHPGEHLGDRGRGHGRGNGDADRRDRARRPRRVRLGVQRVHADEPDRRDRRRPRGRSGQRDRPRAARVRELRPGPGRRRRGAKLVGAAARARAPGFRRRKPRRGRVYGRCARLPGVACAHASWRCCPAPGWCRRCSGPRWPARWRSTRRGGWCFSGSCRWWRAAPQCSSRRSPGCPRRRPSRQPRLAATDDGGPAGGRCRPGAVGSRLEFARSGRAARRARGRAGRAGAALAAARRNVHRQPGPARRGRHPRTAGIRLLRVRGAHSARTGHGARPATVGRRAGADGGRAAVGRRIVAARPRRSPHRGLGDATRGARARWPGARPGRHWSGRRR